MVDRRHLLILRLLRLLLLGLGRGLPASPLGGTCQLALLLVDSLQLSLQVLDDFDRGQIDHSLALL